MRKNASKRMIVQNSRLRRASLTGHENARLKRRKGSKPRDLLPKRQKQKERQKKSVNVEQRRKELDRRSWNKRSANGWMNSENVNCVRSKNNRHL